MKLNSNKQRFASKILLVTKPLLLATAFCYCYAFKQKIDDLWKQLGIEQQVANTSIKESFLSGYLKFYTARNIKNIASGDKVAVAQDLLNYTKQYVNTQFKAAYEKERALSMPHEPQLRPLRTKEEIQKEEVDNLEKSIKKTEADMKTMNDDMKKIFAAGIEQNKKMLAEYKKPGYQLFDLIAQGDKDQQQREVADYKQALKDWETRYPADYKLVIKERLQKLLDVTKDVDFSAALKDVNGKKKFVNPSYESKKPEWKMAFRAGKEVTELTRTFAQQWLGELK
jgi:hypothetical protein